MYHQLRAMPRQHFYALFLTAAVLLASLLLNSVPARGQSVLFIGNSFTWGGNGDNQTSPHGGVPGLFKALAARRGHTPDVTMMAPNGRTFYDQFTNDDNQGDTLAVIRSKKWDYVILQGGSREATTETGSPYWFFRSGTDLNTVIKTNNPNTKVLLYETWAYPTWAVYSGKPVYPTYYASPAAMLQEIKANYQTLASQIGAQVVPVGDVFARALAWNPSYTLNNYDFHANDQGYYLSAMMFYQNIYHENLRGLPTVMTDVTTADTQFLQSAGISFDTGNTAYHLPNGEYHLQCVGTGTFLQVQDFTNPIGTAVTTWGRSDFYSNETWQMTNKGNDYVTLTNKWTGLNLDVWGQSTQQGFRTDGSPPIDQWPANGQSNQSWHLVPAGDGSYWLVAQCSGLALDIYGGNASNGASVVQWPVNGGANQKWVLIY